MLKWVRIFCAYFLIDAVANRAIFISKNIEFRSKSTIFYRQLTNDASKNADINTSMRPWMVIMVK